jgi:hypothetical protein
MALIAKHWLVLLKALNLSFPPQTQSLRGFVAVYRRADLSRNVMLVVALLLTAVSTGVSAREFGGADTRNEDYPTVQALRYMGSPAAEALERTRVGPIDLDRTNVALIGTMRPAMNVPAKPLLFRSIDDRQKVRVSQKAWSRLSLGDQNIFRDAAMAEPFAGTQRDPVARLIERTREVERI